MHELLERAVSVNLSMEEKELATKNGHLLYDYNRVEKKSGENPQHAGVNYKETGWVFEAKSQAAEIAVAKHLGCPEAYIGFSRNPADFKKPDLMGVAEVRRVLEPINPLMVFPKDTKAQALMVKTYYADNTVYILGWRPAVQVWESGWPRGAGRAGYLLEDPQTLSEAFWGRVSA